MKFVENLSIKSDVSWMEEDEEEESETNQESILDEEEYLGSQVEEEMVNYGQSLNMADCIGRVEYAQVLAIHMLPILFVKLGFNSAAFWNIANIWIKRKDSGEMQHAFFHFIDMLTCVGIYESEIVAIENLPDGSPTAIHFEWPVFHMVRMECILWFINK